MFYLPRIKEVRKEKGLTQKMISKKIGMEQTQYSRYERGENEIKVNVLIDICKALNVSSDYILGLSDIQTPNWSISQHAKNITNFTGNNNGTINMN